MEIIKNPINSLPSYEKWMDFLNQQNPSRVNFEPYSLRFAAFRNEATFISDQTENKIRFFQDFQKNIYPIHLSQTSRNISDGQAQTILKDDYLSSNLQLNPDNEVIRSFTIATESHKQRFIGWKQKQRIFMRLNEKYFQSFKKSIDLPNHAGSAIFIENAKGKTELQIEDKQRGTNLLPIDEDVLRQIQNDSGMGFDIDPQSGQIIFHLPRLTCTLEPARIQSVDENKIWNAITGTNRLNPFIFPIFITS